MLRAGMTVASALSTSRATAAARWSSAALSGGACCRCPAAARGQPRPWHAAAARPYGRTPLRSPRARTAPRSGAAAGGAPEHGADSIYSDPELYEAAFSRGRDVLSETHFLVATGARLLGRRPRSFVELACGPARHAVEAARQGLAAAALDASEAMCARARENAAAVAVKLDVARGDMRDCGAAFGARSFDVAAILLGSLSHLLTADDARRCFSSVRGALSEGGVLILELPHPRELFDGSLTGDPQRWTGEFGVLRASVRWGSTRDKLDPINQVLYRKVVVKTSPVGSDEASQAGPSPAQRAVEAIVPTRFFTVPELALLGELSGLRLAELHGDLEPGIAADAEDAGRLVAVFQRT